MKKINIVKKNEDYNRIIKSCKSYKYKDYIAYIEYNKDTTYHFGFCTPKKIGNAVVRNKCKRRIKAILDKISFKNGFNCIIIVKRGILDKNFSEMEKDLLELISKMRIKKEKKNEEETS